jgi:hypothetical protein
MPRTGQFGRVMLAFGAATLCVLLAACSSSHTPGKSTTNTTSTTTSKTTTKSTPVSSGPTTVPGPKQVPFDPAKNARADVATLGACTHASNNDWMLKGTVVNPHQASTGFTIVVDFVKLPGDTVLDTQIVNVPSVSFRHTAHWTASWKYPKNNITCVVRQAQTG